MPFPGFDSLQAFSANAARQLEQFVSYLFGWLSTEHKDDGSHGAVTADSVTTPIATVTALGVTGSGAFTCPVTIQPTTNVVALDVTGSTAGTIAARFGGDASAVANEIDLMTAPTVGGTVVRTASHQVTWGFTDITITGIAKPGGAAINYGGLKVVDSGGVTVLNASGPNAAGGIATDLDVFERQRSVAMGWWTSVSYNSGDYTTDTGTWTVGSGDLGTFAYTLVGKTMTIALVLNTTTVATNPTQLRVTIPGGFTAAASSSVGAGLCTDNGTAAAVCLRAVSGQTYVLFTRLDGAAFANATNATQMQGVITFEVQ